MDRRDDHRRAVSMVWGRAVSITMSTPDLQRLFRAVAPAASTDYARPVLSGVLITVDEFALTAVASDSYRLHKVTVPRVDATQPCKGLVPAAWLLRWARIPFPDRSFTTLAIDDERIALVTSDEHQSTRLISGEFPAYEPMLAANELNDESSNFNAVYLAAAFAAADEWANGRPLRTVAFNHRKPCKFVVDAPLGRLDLLVMPVYAP